MPWMTLASPARATQYCWQPIAALPTAICTLRVRNNAREGSILISGATRIILDANAGAVGGATIEYSLGGGRWQPYTGPFTINNSGTFDLAYRARNSLRPSSAAGQRVVVDAQGTAITSATAARRMEIATRLRLSLEP